MWSRYPPIPDGAFSRRRVQARHLVRDPVLRSCAYSVTRVPRSLTLASPIAEGASRNESRRMGRGILNNRGAGSRRLRLIAFHYRRAYDEARNGSAGDVRVAPPLSLLLNACGSNLRLTFTNALIFTTRIDNCDHVGAQVDI